jgi:selenocysteine-specific elongation factor
MTGTVLAGQVKVGDVVELPSLKIEKKIKSMQMFRKPVQIAKQGDRVGMCVSQLDANDIERGIACSPGSMKTCETVIAIV